MLRIKTLNAISKVIEEHLPQPLFNVADGHDIYEAILVRSYKCHGMDFPKELLAIARAGAGVNNIPIDECTQKGICVFNTPGANANAVKELVLAAMLMVSRNILDGIDWTMTLKGKGEEVPALVEQGKSQFVGPELKNKRLGVIGLGAIGVMVANAAHSIGMEVTGYDPFISVESAWHLSRGIQRETNLDNLLASCDYITLHIPLIDKDNYFIGQKEIGKMKQGAYLFNFARAELVDLAYLAEALKSGAISKYVVDFPTEAVLGMQGAIAIPHLGASTPESEDNCAHMAAQQLYNYIMLGNIRNSVNMPTCELPFSGKLRLAMIHRNVTNMVGQITAVLADKGANIANMINTSRGDIAYTVIDLDNELNGDVLSRLEGIEGMVRVRALKPV